MKKQQFIVYIFILLSIITKSTLAQQNNFNQDYSAYLPEVRGFNKQLSHQIPMPDSAAKTKIKPSVTYIDGPAGKLALRIFKPPLMKAIVFDIHGGGWCEGMAAFDDRLNDEMARECKVAVESFDYRLAPASPFPACINDCKATAKWLVNNAVKTFGTDKLFISGGSTGGHLAAVTTL